MTGTERTLPSTEEAPLTDEDLAAKIRGRLNELCELIDQMHHRDWIVEPRLYSDDIGRWHAHCRFTKTVTL